MTAEAEKYLRRLVKANPKIVCQWIEEQGEIKSVILKRGELNKIMVDRLLYFARNGSPEIVVEYRSQDIEFENGAAFEFKSIEGMDYLKGKDCNIFFIPIDDIDKPHTGYSKKVTKEGLFAELKEAEAEENYERCAEIMKFAKEKGISLQVDCER